MSKVNCTECAWLVKTDAGYSNYTVEETHLECLMDKHPLLPATATWQDEGLLGVECSSYRKGTPAHLDVDLENALEWKKGMPMWERVMPYFEDELVQAVIKLKQWRPDK